MMMRKYIAILLMTFANMFILVHACVPHYHHQGVVTLNSSTEANCRLCNLSCESDGCSHQADAHHGMHENCDIYKVLGRDGNPIDDSASLTPSITEFLVCFCTVDCATLLTPANIELTSNEAYRPYIDTYNSPYIGSSFGLRAPPASII